MHDPAFERHPPGDAVATGDECSLALGRPILGLRCTDERRHVAVDLALAYCDRSGIGAAKPDGGFGNCVQHRLHIGGRAADDVEHVAGRGLVFERFFEVARAGLQFAEQPRVLHRDDCLGGEVFQERDLFVRERPHLAHGRSEIMPSSAPSLRSANRRLVRTPRSAAARATGSSIRRISVMWTKGAPASSGCQYARSGER